MAPGFTATILRKTKGTGEQGKKGNRGKGKGEAGNRSLFPYSPFPSFPFYPKVQWTIFVEYKTPYISSWCLAKPEPLLESIKFTSCTCPLYFL